MPIFGFINANFGIIVNDDAEEKSEFEPLMHPKSDTQCPYPIPATSSMQMGADPSTHTHP